MFCIGGNGEPGPFKSLILLQKFQIWKKKETVNIIDGNNESHTQTWCTYKSVNFTRVPMVLGIGPTKPLAWIAL